MPGKSGRWFMNREIETHPGGWDKLPWATQRVSGRPGQDWNPAPGGLAQGSFLFFFHCEINCNQKI